MRTAGSIIAIVIFWAILSCSKDKSYEPLDISYQGKIKVNDETVVNDKINYKDIIGYDSGNHTFLIDTMAVKRLEKYYYPNGGLPFSVNVTGETVYSGKFFPQYSQVLPYGITIDPYPAGNKLTVKIDYGFCRTDNALPDPRNDRRIITILQKDKKLIKIKM